MKRQFVKYPIYASNQVCSASTDVYSLLGDIPEDEFSKMSKAEKRIIAKAKNSTHADVYLVGAADAIELTGASVTDAFINFYNRVIENWKFENSEVTGSSGVDDQFGIGVFDKDDCLIGWLSSFSQSRGSALIRCSVKPDHAKLYSSQTSAKKAMSYYQYFDEIYVFIENRSNPVSHYARWRADVDLEELSKTAHMCLKSVEGCYLKVISIND